MYAHIDEHSMDLRKRYTIGIFPTTKTCNTRLMSITNKRQASTTYHPNNAEKDDDFS